MSCRPPFMCKIGHLEDNYIMKNLMNISQKSCDFFIIINSILIILLKCYKIVIKIVQKSYENNMRNSEKYLKTREKGFVRLA